ncbi:MAG: heme biosynthesis protein HemY [Rhodospirillaceae bacterium]|nr:heme biosynthesis protein HemY [Rhodospirillaceae bacterium]
MWRALLFLVWIAVLGAAAVWVGNRPGTLVVQWLGYRVEAPVGVAIVVLLILMAAAALLYHLWRLLVTAPRKIAHSRASNRRRHGYRALTQGMVAVAAGDAGEARRQQRRAAALLDEPPLTLLLAAQAAQLEGDETAARRYFEEMLKRPETAFLGVRGLLMQAIRTGDTAEALRWAARAHAERPHAAWATATLLDLQLQSGAWDAAERTLREAARLKAIGAEEVSRKRAVLLAEAALRSDDRTGQALPGAREAVKLAPAFLPARLALTRLLSLTGRRREAAKAIEQAWALQPHPALAAAYAALEPGEKPIDRVRRFERLFAAGPRSREALLTMAEVNLDAGLWGPARQDLEQALELEGHAAGTVPTTADGGGPVAKAVPSARLCRLMARLEEGETQDGGAARRWLMAASLGGPEPAWVCDKCGTPAAAWSARCAHCGSFDTLEWRPLPWPGEGRLPAVPGATEPPRPGLPPAAGTGASDPAAPVDAARLVN